jgi:Phosphoserine phosphatase RsbU, N-terminal domain
VSAPDAATARERLQRDYRPAFLRYLSRRDEPGRHAGYVIGRAAVTAGQSMLDVVAAHHVTLLEVLPEARDPDEVLAMSTAASEFLTEVLASFSMASGAVAGMAQQLEDAQRELVVLRAQVTPGTG